MSIILESHDLCKRYGNIRTGFEALRGVNITLSSGQITGLLGPNGSGKTTFIKTATGLLQPTSGTITIDGMPVGPQTKAVVSYLPERTYFSDWMKTTDMLEYFRDFYEDFDIDRACDMLNALDIRPDQKLRNMSKGTKEKVQLVMVMSRRAKLYILDEPIAGVDPASRDFILRTILSNYDPEAAILISTHLITDIEQILDHVIFLQEGCVRLAGNVDDIRNVEGKSIDALFREVFRC